MKKKFEFKGRRSAWVNEQTENKNETDRAVEEIKHSGFTIFESCFGLEDLTYARQRIDAIYKQQVEEVGGEEVLRTIGDENIARQLLVYDEHFLKYAIYDKMLKVVQRLLGDYYILYQQNANIHIPHVGHTSTPWHRDPTFKHYTSSRPLFMSALLTIDDYNEENGGLYVLPGSHLHEPFPSFDYVEKHKKQLTAKAGSLILQDAMMFHTPGINRSDKLKRSMTQFYTMHLVRQEVSIPRMLKGKWANDKFLQQFLGYNHQTFYSVKDYRLERYENKRKELTVMERGY